METKEEKQGQNVKENEQKIEENLPKTVPIPEDVKEKAQTNLQIKEVKEGEKVEKEEKEEKKKKKKKKKKNKEGKKDEKKEEIKEIQIENKQIPEEEKKVPLTQGNKKQDNSALRLIKNWEDAPYLQTTPPTIPLSKQFPNGNFPLGKIVEYQGQYFKIDI